MVREAHGRNMKLEVVMTLGPASTENAVIERLARTADRFRLNAAHLNRVGLGQWLDRLEDVFARAGQRIPVVIDLQGAKMRVGAMPTVSELPPEVRLIFSAQPTTTADIIGLPHAELFEQVGEGEELSLNDGKVRLRIESVDGDEICARVVKNGPLSSFKGINRPDHPITLNALSAADLGRIEVGDAYAFVEYAFSFAAKGRDAALLREKTHRRVTAKIELREAADCVADLDAKFDELWLCRGDLGEQVGIGQLGLVQHKFSKQIPSLKRPAFLAGQVLEHMTHFEQPTRSEVVHLFDVEQAGYAGVVLSDETAVGRNPTAVADLLDFLRQR
ncbi:MAG: hypothetical protein A2341_13895 [Deltaproteobacteria bacterium RIFOXYB12_FULL_58_9]|nr:MAG: hypothetical protein A2341_13895 [Deltaproteobacteria bacterium RIFOXYB12_FULL_58_9]